MCSPRIRAGGAIRVKIFDSGLAFGLIGVLAKRIECGIRDIRVKFRPINPGEPRPRDTATVRPLRWQRLLYRVVANRDFFCAQPLVKKKSYGRVLDSYP